MYTSMKKIYSCLARWLGIRSVLCLLLIIVSLKLMRSTNQIETLRSETTDSDEPKCELPWWDGAMDNCSLVMQTFIDQNNSTRSYCGKRADIIGEGQKVITYCLYGKFDRYASGLPHILQTVQTLYPGWVVRLYTEPQNYTRELLPLMLQYPHLYLCDVGNLPGSIADWRDGNYMLWRTAVMGDELVDVFLSRDMDAMILEREAAAVNEFLESGKGLHIMRDNPKHLSKIMGGMYGIRQKSSNRDLLNSIREKYFAERSMPETDQHLLKIFLYPALKNDVVIHDSYSCKRSNNSRPFPTQRQDQTFVGNRRYRAHLASDSIKETCPIECRPPTHPDWEYC